MKYDLQERVFLVKKYYEFKSFSDVQRAYRVEFNKNKAPDRKVIFNIVSVFEKTGSVSQKPRQQKEISMKRQDAKIQLETMVSEFPNLSLRKMASSLNISPTLVFNILHDDMHLKSYKYQTWHKLEVQDYKPRVKFAEWFLSKPLQTENFFIFSDEAYFTLTLPLNKQNNRIWADSSPEIGIEMPLFDKKILVWCGISVNRIFGPYYFEKPVNQHNYLEMLQKFFWPKVLRTASYEKYYFQQDGATPHTANDVQDWLKSKFLNKFVDKRMWPPRSPDLNPCDFFLWGHLKSLVYNPLPKTLDDLKINIEREIKNISKNVLKSTFENFQKRCSLIISASGGHIE